MTQNPLALALIALTHTLIDHFRLARYWIYLRDQFCPYHERYPFKFASMTGFHQEGATPAYLGFYIYVIVDNTMHILPNAVILYYLG